MVLKVFQRPQPVATYHVAEPLQEPFVPETALAVSHDSEEEPVRPRRRKMRAPKPKAAPKKAKGKVRGRPKPTKKTRGKKSRRGSGEEE